MLHDLRVGKSPSLQCSILLYQGLKPKPHGRAMKPAPFEYHRAESVNHAIDLLSQYGSDCRLLAGGQSLIPMMNLRLARPEVLIDIGRLPLQQIDASPGSITLGALVRHRELLKNGPVSTTAPIVPAAARHIAHPTIRNLGTTGGSVAYADPTAELSAVLVLLDGNVTVRSHSGGRTIEADAFFRGAFETSLDPTEMILSLHLRPPALPHGSCFLEVSERQGDYAIAAAGVVVVMDDGIAQEARIVLSGAEARPIRAREAEAFLVGKTIDRNTAQAAAVLAVSGQESYDDIRATAGYRMALLRALTERAIMQATAEL
jgi:CO/xanthine dehydrogenase FAD-binding subunit